MCNYLQPQFSVIDNNSGDKECSRDTIVGEINHNITTIESDTSMSHRRLYRGKPTVFNLPQNPLGIKSFKYTFIKSRVEKSRADILN